MTSAPSRRRKLSTSAVASNPSELIDKYLAALEEHEADDTEARRPPGGKATFEEVAARWRRFSTVVASIERALGEPLAPGTCVVLLAARQLGECVGELCDLVANIGEAIDSRGDSVQLGLLREFGVPMSVTLKR
jgi:hypothetical protein